MYQFHTHILAWLQLWSLGTNKLRGVNICSLINYTPIVFTLELIWVDWSKRNVADFWFSKYRISANSFRGNYSFLILAETIRGNTICNFLISKISWNHLIVLIGGYKIKRRYSNNDTFWLFSFLKSYIFWIQTQFLI